MYVNGEDRFYYIMVYNEDYTMPEMPEGSREGIVRGIYKFKESEGKKAIVQLFGSGPILNEAVRAQAILAEKYDVQANVWSVTSYNELRRDALAVERWNRLHPAEEAKQPYILTALQQAKATGPIVAASDYIKAVPDQLAPWLEGRLVSLGTDGFGRSDNRQHLRKHFEINAESIAATALSRLARDGKFDAKRAQKAMKELGIDQLSVADRLALMEEIWDSIVATPDQVPLTEAQKQELDRRIADLRANPNDVLTWEETKDHVWGQR
jgi:pyruvate dehydrogenase E1 component